MNGEELLLTDEIIDLRKNDTDYYGEYGIYLHDTNTEIGNICYRGYHCSEYLGDIGYWIDEEYRGNSYSYNALCLLSNYLYNNGVMDFWITVKPDNMASISIIEKYGIVSVKKIDDRSILYTCETRLITKEKSNGK